MNTNYATSAGLNPADAILREDPKGPYVNVIAVRVGDKDKPWVKELVASYHSPEVKVFIAEKFKAAVIASWQGSQRRDKPAEIAAEWIASGLTREADAAVGLAPTNTLDDARTARRVQLAIRSGNSTGASETLA